MDIAHGKIHLSSAQVILFGFALLILAGALLLMLPVSSASGVRTSFGDALFTAVSAVCVTGLVVVNTATYWSMFGQVVILILIQIGGMGVVMAVSMLAIASGRKIGLMQRSTMQDAMSAPQIGGIVRLTKQIVRLVAAIELSGAVLLSIRFIPQFGVAKGIWYSIFHSISAFCNAGFDLMGNSSPFCSLTDYSSDPLVSLTIAGLIIAGGLGFLTWDDLHQHGFHWGRYRLQTKLILTAALLLTALPTLYFYFFEYTGYNGGERVLVSFFQAVTPRTAGFNTADLTVLSGTGIIIMISLMLTGGAPGSTAGGMKTTTICVLFLSAKAVFKRNEKANCYQRSLDNTVRENACALFLLYFVLFLTGGCLISIIDDLPVLSCLFETASAIGTVGLTLGLTPLLSPASRLILIALMFLGRIGGMTLIYAVLPQKKQAGAHYITEKVTVG